MTLIRPHLCDILDVARQLAVRRGHVEGVSIDGPVQAYDEPGVGLAVDRLDGRCHPLVLVRPRSECLVGGAASRDKTAFRDIIICTYTLNPNPES